MTNLTPSRLGQVCFYIGQQGRASGGATVVRFPRHPVVVRPAADGGFHVIWRGWAWRHVTRSDALADASAIAGAHGVRVLESDGRVP
jgi:hypothetical protein